MRHAVIGGNLAQGFVILNDTAYQRSAILPLGWHGEAHGDPHAVVRGAEEEYSQAVVPVQAVCERASREERQLVGSPSHVVVLATHYGLFRSQDGGICWQEVAGGSKQLMDGLMTYLLAHSPLNAKRLYGLTQPSFIPHAGTVGLYTSVAKPITGHETRADQVESRKAVGS